MLESTRRGLTKECPRCGAEKKVPCLPAAPWIHAARRDLFWIDTGLPKPKSKRLSGAANL